MTSLRQEEGEVPDFPNRQTHRGRIGLREILIHAHFWSKNAIQKPWSFYDNLNY